MLKQEQILQETCSQSNAQQSLKITHIMEENCRLQQALSTAELVIHSLRNINQSLLSESIMKEKDILIQLNAQCKILEENLKKSQKQCETLACQLLLKNQIIKENENQFNDIIKKCEERMYELRILIQKKETATHRLEEQLKVNEVPAYNPYYLKQMYFTCNQKISQLNQQIQENISVKLLRKQILQKFKEQGHKQLEGELLSSFRHNSKKSSNNIQGYLSPQLIKREQKLKELKNLSNEQYKLLVVKKDLEIKLYISKILDLMTKLQQKNIKINLISEVNQFLQKQLSYYKSSGSRIEKRQKSSKQSINLNVSGEERLAEITEIRNVRKNQTLDDVILDSDTYNIEESNDFQF